VPKSLIAPLTAKVPPVATVQFAPLPAQALAWIAKLYEIESHIKDHPPDKKLLARQTQSRPVVTHHASLDKRTHASAG